MIITGVLVDLIIEAGCETKSIEYLMRRSRGDFPIRSLDLRPSLFEKHRPDFPAICLAENRPIGSGKHRHEIINDYFRDNAFPVGYDLVDTMSVDCKVPKEDVLNSQRSLGHSGYSCQEIAISHVALLYLCRIDPIFSHDYIVMQDLWDPLPCDLPVVDGVIKRVLVAGEVLIDKLFVVVPAFRMQLIIVRCPDHDSSLIG